MHSSVASVYRVGRARPTHVLSVILPGTQSPSRASLLDWAFHGGQGRRAGSAAEEPDPGHRRGHGDDDPVPQARGGRVPRRPVRRSFPRPEGLQRHPEHHPAGDDRGDPPGLPRGGRRHHRDQHLQLQRSVPGRLRPGGPRLRPEPGGRPGRTTRRRRGRGASGAPLLRGGRPGPDHQIGRSVDGFQQPGREEHHVRAARGRLFRAGPRPGGRRRRRAARRDGLRHVEPEGGPLCRGAVLRGARRAPSAHGFGDHRRPLGPDDDGADGGGVLGLHLPCAAPQRRLQLRPRPEADEALRRGAVAPRPRVPDLLPQRGASRPSPSHGVSRGSERHGPRAPRVRASRASSTW